MDNYPTNNVQSATPKPTSCLPISSSEPRQSPHRLRGTPWPVAGRWHRWTPAAAAGNSHLQLWSLGALLFFERFWRPLLGWFVIGLLVSVVFCWCLSRFEVQSVGFFLGRLFPCSGFLQHHAQSSFGSTISTIKQQPVPKISKNNGEKKTSQTLMQIEEINGKYDRIRPNHSHFTVWFWHHPSYISTIFFSNSWYMLKQIKHLPPTHPPRPCSSVGSPSPKPPAWPRRRPPGRRRRPRRRRRRRRWWRHGWERRRLGQLEACKWFVSVYSTSKIFMSVRTFQDPTKLWNI